MQDMGGMKMDNMQMSAKDNSGKEMPTNSSKVDKKEGMQMNDNGDNAQNIKMAKSNIGPNKYITNLGRQHL